MLTSGCRPAPPSEPPVERSTPGVRRVRAGPVLSAQEAADRVASAAETAGKNNTYGVAGLLLDPEGRLLATAYNQVFSGGQIQDPTAHAERQLIDWYFEQLHQGVQLPPASDLTIVSSLDPCPMCAGSILRSGMKVWVLCLDQYGGVSSQGEQPFATLPPNLQKQAQRQFSYPGVEGERTFRGASDGLFGERSISRASHHRALKAFEESLPRVLNRQQSRTFTLASLQDPGRLKSGALLAKAKAFHPSVLSMRLEPDANPDARLAARLLELADRSEGNAGALIDPYGNVLLALGGREETSPIQTPVFRLCRNYYSLRRYLGEPGRAYFPPLKFCRLVTLRGPEANAVGVAEVGAFCSSVRGPFPNDSEHWVYFQATQASAELNLFVERLYPKKLPQIRVAQDPEALELVSPHTPE